MTLRPALSVRDAVADVRRTTPHRYHVHAKPPAARTGIAHDFAVRYAGVPATGLSRSEDVVLYSGEGMPVLLGLYGDEARVRSWLPGLPGRVSPASAGALLAGCHPPKLVAEPACQALTAPVDLAGLPVLQATARDAGPYLTMGLVYAEDPLTGAVALSVHRMLVLDRTRLTIWLVPGRQLRAMHAAAVRRGARLPVSINVGAPPAAMVASALGSRFLPEGVGKLAVAGALAGEPIRVAPALTQPTRVLADSELVLEGFLDGAVADECVQGPPEVSLPELLGYDGSARSGLPVITLTGMSTRPEAVYQATIGPGREQSIILGLAGAVSCALSVADAGLLHDLHFAPAGGGMLLLVAAVRKDGPSADGQLERIARCLFEQHPFLKLIIFTDDDIDISSMEDVMWAVTTRANLGADCTTFPGFTPLGMDPSQQEGWSTVGGRRGGSGRTFVDATVPYRLRPAVARSFPPGQPGPAQREVDRSVCRRAGQPRSA
jgi:4-hydroxy-3-polyprenylbenzoate decarboxylase